MHELKACVIKLLTKVKLLAGYTEREMLPLPYTLPDKASAYQLLSVVEDMNNDCKMHVIFANSMDYAESWGSYLAEVGSVIARDYADDLDTLRSDGDLFAAICDGFLRSITAERRLCVATPDSYDREPLK